MILGISFLESWVKFRAPSLQKSVGLDVGRTVFNIFQKVQISFLFVIFSSSLVFQISNINWIILLNLTLILYLQFFWLFPKLANQVDFIIAGGQSTSSSVHQLYGVLELIKFILLLIFSLKLIL